MPRYSLKEAIEMRLKNFATYALSLWSAMLLYRAFTETLDAYRQNSIWALWVAALVGLIFAMLLLILITWADPSDEEES